MKPTNPISNTVGSISDKIDFLISAPYADKLPLKVAELVRKDVPFAVLLPLSLLNEIERTGKTSVDESVRKKRLDMKLIIATSLGQGWLVNHPECRVLHTLFSSQHAHLMNSYMLKALKPFTHGLIPWTAPKYRLRR